MPAVQEPDTVGHAIVAVVAGITGGSLAVAPVGAAWIYQQYLYTIRDRSAEEDDHILGIREALADRERAADAEDGLVLPDEMYKRFEVIDGFFTQLEEQQKRKRILVASLVQPFDVEELGKRVESARKEGNQLDRLFKNMLGLGSTVNSFFVEGATQDELVQRGADFANKIEEAKNFVNGTTALRDIEKEKVKTQLDGLLEKAGAVLSPVLIGEVFSDDRMQLVSSMNNGGEYEPDLMRSMASIIQGAPGLGDGASIEEWEQLFNRIVVQALPDYLEDLDYQENLNQKRLERERLKQHPHAGARYPSYDGAGGKKEQTVLEHLHNNYDGVFPRQAVGEDFPAAGSVDDPHSLRKNWTTPTVPEEPDPGPIRDPQEGVPVGHRRGKGPVRRKPRSGAGHPMMPSWAAAPNADDADNSYYRRARSILPEHDVYPTMAYPSAASSGQATSAEITKAVGEKMASEFAHLHLQAHTGDYPLKTMEPFKRHDAANAGCVDAQEVAKIVDEKILENVHNALRIIRPGMYCPARQG